MSEKNARRTIFQIVLSALSSLGLTCILLIILLYLTWAGTLAQIDIGLYAAQKKYFESIFLMEQLGPVPVPIPGGLLVLSLLALNLLVGGLLRVRWRLRNVGVLIGHLGIQLLLLAGFVKYAYSVEGMYMAYEGQTRAEIVSYHDWEVVVGEPLPDGKLEEHVIPAALFDDLEQGERVTFRSPKLPFELELYGYLQSSRVRPATNDGSTTHPVVDGFYLEPLESSQQRERDAAAAYMNLRESGSGRTQRGLLWGHQTQPLTLTVADRTFTFNLRKQHTPLGFKLRLEKFTKSDHPGTSMARDYRSRVTTLDGGLEQTVEIMMNEPLRYNGFIFYQSSWGPQNARPGEPLYSVLSVVSNPSDQWPLWSCVVISCGMLLHFLLKLFNYTRTQLARAS